MMIDEESLIDRIIKWENGKIPFDKTIELFQDLIDTGLAWNLHGMYGRTADRLINAGFCTVKEGRAKSMYIEKEE